MWRMSAASDLKFQCHTLSKTPTILEGGIAFGFINFREINIEQ